MITAKLAMQWRERGLLLPLDKQYTVNRVLDIAERQQYLMHEMNQLDAELKRLAGQESINGSKYPCPSCQVQSGFFHKDDCVGGDHQLNCT